MKQHPFFCHSQCGCGSDILRMTNPCAMVLTQTNWHGGWFGRCVITIRVLWCNYTVIQSYIIAYQCISLHIIYHICIYTHHYIIISLYVNLYIFILPIFCVSPTQKIQWPPVAVWGCASSSSQEATRMRENRGMAKHGIASFRKYMSNRRVNIFFAIW